MSSNHYAHEESNPSSRKPPTDFQGLEQTNKLILDQIIQDARLIPDLKDLVSNILVTPPSYVAPPDCPWELYHQSPLIPIPEALFSHFQSNATRSHLGIFPEIQRAWISIDERLFLWDYVNGAFDSYTEQSEVITAVGLIKPKQGIFVEDIKHVMVVCTSGSIILIGVSLTTSTEPSEKDRSILKLYATDMTISTKAVAMHCVAGSAEGRIFLTGSDGHLYELEYAAAESWFSAKVALRNRSTSYATNFMPAFLIGTPDAHITQIVMDDLRHCMYTVNSRQTVSVYYLGVDGLDTNITPRATLSDIARQAQNLAPGIANFSARPFEVTALHIVSPSEAQSDVHAVIITSQGLRLYISHKGSSYGYPFPSSTPGSSSIPTGLRILHVRPPPANMIHPDDATPSALQYGMSNPQQLTPRVFQISAISNSFYGEGLFLAAQASHSTSDGMATLVCTFPDVSSIAGLRIGASSQPVYGSHAMTTYQRPTLTENVKLLPVAGDPIAIAELQRSSPRRHSPQSPAPSHELAHQFSANAREMLILSNIGLTNIVKLRPVDVLHSLIVIDNRPDLEAFWKSYGRDQTCAMLYAILANNSYIVRSSRVPNSSLRVSRGVDPSLNARQLLFAIGGKPTMSTAHLESSGRLNGLLLYVARLVRPIWSVKFAKKEKQGNIALDIPEEVLVSTRHNLQLLRDLCDGDPFLFQAPPGEHRTSGGQDDAWKTELASASLLATLVAQAVEAISFVLLLHDFNIANIASRCDPADQQKLTNISFSELVTTQGGRELARTLVNAVINQQISQQVNVDTISDVLQQRCGSFCSTDDVMLYKADENVRRASDTKNAAERTQALIESLRLYSKGCKNLHLEKLQDITNEYRKLRYAKGAIELPLRCAQEWDIDKSGREHWLAGCPAQDPRAEAYNLRVQCYDLVIGSLQAFDDLVTAAKGPSGQDIVVDDSEYVSQTAYRTALGSRDIVFHSTLYDWLVEKGSADELLDIDTPFLEGHLQREPLSLRNGELLWQYYVKSGQYLKAAQTLEGLAESSRFAISLEKRIEFLSFAVGNAKSHPASDVGREENAIAFLTQLEEKLEVAQAQLELLHVLEQEYPDTDTFVEQKILELRGSFKTVTELYEGFAEPLNMPEMKLLLLYVSEHDDPQLAISNWKYLFEQLGNAETLEEEFHAVANLIERLGRRYYPSPSAFPTDYITKTLEDLMIKNRTHVPPGWAPRVLVRANLPHQVIFELLYEIYESQVPPYNVQVNVQALSTDIAILLSDWLDEIGKSRSLRGEFHADAIGRIVETLRREVAPSNVETRKMYEEISRRIRSVF